ncbi:MAG: hypothetical protein UZ19_OD1000741 [Parcubacteria bacterium OLB19]|nr:MAG: hypothetical protein UZ19_OD1000741 [Parcubacteria bacterium OLB19]
MFKKQTNNRGVALVEVLIGVTLVTIIVAFVGLAVTQFVNTRNVILSDTKKMYLAEEGYEIVRYLRDENWSNVSSLTNDTYYFLQVSTTTLSIGGSSELIDGVYNRSFLVQPVYRGASGSIVDQAAAGAVLDSDTKKLIVYVSDTNGTTSVSALLTNLP